VSLFESRKERKVDPSGDMVRFAKSLGISFGNEAPSAGGGGG